MQHLYKHSLELPNNVGQILVNSNERLHHIRAPNSAASHTLLSLMMKFKL